jgi:hypothetical protein
MINVADIDVREHDWASRDFQVPGWFLIRADGRVVGELWLLSDDSVDERGVSGQIIEELGSKAFARQSARALAESGPFSSADVAVVVVTDGRLDPGGSFDSLGRLDPQPGEIVVVDMTDDGVALEATQRMGAVWVDGSNSGVVAARNLGWHSASQPIVAFIDAQSMVDYRFSEAIAAAFAGDRVAAVTGLTLAASLETPGQLIFEQRLGGLHKGFRRQIFHRDLSSLHPEPHQVGSGSNMAFKREVLQVLEGFDPSFQVAGSARGADLDIWDRLLAAGYAIVYEPDALVRSSHPGGLDELKQRIRSDAVGTGRFLAGRASRGAVAARAVRHRVRHRRIGLLVRGLKALGRGDLVHLSMLLAEHGGRRAGFAMVPLEGEPQ